MLEQNIEYKSFVYELSKLLEKNNANKKIVFVCIGTSKLIGDAIGPSVGSYLKSNSDIGKKFEIIGDIKNNISYKNIENSMISVKSNTNNLIIVIDSALSTKRNIGKVFIENSGLKYGEGLKKINKPIGDISIKAVVGENYNSRLKNFITLKNTPIERVKFMSNLISKGIMQVVSSNVV